MAGEAADQPSRSRRRGKRTALAALGVSLTALLAALVAGKSAILEQWYLRELRSGSTAERYRAALELGKRGSVKSIPHLIQLLRESEDHFEEASKATPYDGISPDNIVALAFEGIGKPAVPALIEALADKSESCRAGAVMCLGFIGSEARGALPSIIKLLGDRSQTVHFSAAVCLGLWGNDARDAIPALEAALRDRYEPVRYAAARSLKQIRGE